MTVPYVRIHTHKLLWACAAFEGNWSETQKNESGKRMPLEKRAHSLCFQLLCCRHCCFALLSLYMAYTHTSLCRE